MRVALRLLDDASSTYATAFAQLCKDVLSARVEANDNVRYLAPLRPWLERLEGEEHFPNVVAVRCCRHAPHPTKLSPVFRAPLLL